MLERTEDFEPLGKQDEPCSGYGQKQQVSGGLRSLLLLVSMGFVHRAEN
jgi:hypothetical protein